jgi:CheY-like chemotaxis protein
MLLSDVAQPEWRLWQASVGEALLAGQQLQVIVERRVHASTVVLSREERESLVGELRDPQHRIVQAMTRLLTLVPTDLDDELLLGDARAIRDLALSLGDDDAPEQPHDPARARPPQAGSLEPEAGPGTPCLLVVDDVESLRFMLVSLLEELGYDVVAAANGVAAMAIAERQRIDVILSDIDMPECDGFELLRRLKANDATRDIPVIVVSGVGDVASVVRCIELGAEDHLTKPFDSLLLQARVRASLERKQLRDAEVVYLRRVAQLTLAAEEVESATYQPGSLGSLARLDDELGRLARVFDRVVSGWQSRETMLECRVQRLKNEVQESKRRPSLSLLPILEAGSLAIGDLFAERYEILEELGSGGMGVVYRAYDRQLGEEIAIKFVRAGVLQPHEGSIERFKMEIRLARRITHPNVVRTHDFGEWQGTHYLTMEFVAGITVQSLLEIQGRLSVASTLAIGTQLAEALEVAHEQQIIHRDIKPANLLVDDEGVLKVMDFGLAQLFENSDELSVRDTIMGTPRYMAPERLFGFDVDGRSDLFSAGAVLYECLTGVAPFDADSPKAIVARMQEGPPTPVGNLLPDVTPAFAALINRLLSYKPQDRLQSARELVERLHEIG